MEDVSNIHEYGTIRKAPAESMTEAELEAFDQPARQVFRDALADGADTTGAGEAFMRWYGENAGMVSDIGKEERANETQHKRSQSA